MQSESAHAGIPEGSLERVSPALPSASAPLDLTYRPALRGNDQPSVRSEALNDPRVVTRMTQSERFAANLGTDTSRQEDALNGGRRYRRGTSCTEVYDTRIGTLDSYNQALRPSPKVGKSCK
jgi:hypothetical protein